MLDIGGSPGTDWWPVQGIPDLSPAISSRTWMDGNLCEQCSISESSRDFISISHIKEQEK